MTESELAKLVLDFYANVRRDQLIGPLFNSTISDWPEHLEKLADFWSSIMLTTGRYKGSPVAAHRRHVDRIEPEMFERWLALWRETAHNTLSRSDAEVVIAKADRIAESLQLAMWFKPDTQRSAA